MRFLLNRPSRHSVKNKYGDKIGSIGLKIDYEEDVDHYEERNRRIWGEDYEGYGVAYVEITTLEDLINLSKAVKSPLIINCVDPSINEEEPEITIYDDYIE